MNPKISLNKRTLRVLTQAEEALVSGGSDSSEIDEDDGGDGGNYGSGGGGGDEDVKPPKGTFDSECRCASDKPVCGATKNRQDKGCDASD